MRTSSFFSVCLLSLGALGQNAPSIEWQRSIGGPDKDYAFSVQYTSDGGYIMAGWTGGNGGDVSGYHGGYYDAWVVKLDAQANLEWQRSLGGSDNDNGQSVMQTNDGGYIMAVSSLSVDGDITGNHGSVDAWIVKLDPDGTVNWSMAYGGTDNDDATAIQQTSDGGYVVAGLTRSNDGDVQGNHGSMDAWVLKLDAAGGLQWQKCLGGTGYDAAYSIQQTSDGGFVFAGETGSTDGDVSGCHGGFDCWVVKLDGSGNIQWQRALGGSGNDIANFVLQSEDGGFIMVGEADSNDGDVTGYHGGGDSWIVKMDATGGLQWQRCFGGSSLDSAYGIQQVGDSGYIVAGYSESEDGDIAGYHGERDAWLLRIDDAGSLLWQKAMGGSDWDEGISIQLTNDGGYIVAGASLSNDGDVSGNHGSSDCWLVKLGPDQVGIAEQQEATRFSLFPNPTTDAVHVQFQLAASEPEALNVLDAAGRLAGTLPEGRLTAGKHELSYSLKALPPGSYSNSH